MQHIFAITENKRDWVNKLFERKCDGEYIVLNMSNGFCDIAQWSDKYQNVKILTLPIESLDKTMRLA